MTIQRHRPHRPHGQPRRRENTRLLWPAHYDLRRIPVRDPTPVYPHSLIWHRDNPHPALTTLRNYLRSIQAKQRGTRTWAPNWATPPSRSRHPGGRALPLPGRAELRER